MEVGIIFQRCNQFYIIPYSLNGAYAKIQFSLIEIRRTYLRLVNIRMHYQRYCCFVLASVVFELQQRKQFKKCYLKMKTKDIDDLADIDNPKID